MAMSSRDEKDPVGHIARHPGQKHCSCSISADSCFERPEEFTTESRRGQVLNIRSVGLEATVRIPGTDNAVLGQRAPEKLQRYLLGCQPRLGRDVV